MAEISLARPHYVHGGRVFSMPFDPYYLQQTASGVDEKFLQQARQQDPSLFGVPSLMNEFAYVTLDSAARSGYASLYDRQERRWYDGGYINETLNPSVANLVNHGPFSRVGNRNQVMMSYEYADFAYCKWYGLIPNNRLITLRRFTCPVTDNLEMPDWAPDKSANKAVAENKFIPLARAVTWLGKETGNQLSTLMSFKASLPWSDAKGPDGNETNDSSMLSDTTQAGGMSSAFKMISILTGEGDIKKNSMNGFTPQDPYQGGPYANRVLGGVNRINSVKKRDPGLKFENSISLKFHYVARSLDTVNPKAAMLDIIANFLTLTYGVGAFWGGMHRHHGRIVAYPWKEGMHAWYSGDAIGFIKASKNALEKIGNNIESFINSLKNNPNAALEKLANAALNVGMGALMQSLGAHPEQLPQMRALLTGEPVGEWHLVIGNPYNPIMTIGNLICSGCNFEFSNDLGPDDFPNEMTVTVTLEHGKSRDRHDIESIFNRGNGRIYTIPDGLENTTAANETKVDQYTGANRKNLTSKSTWFTTEELCKTIGEYKGTQTNVDGQVNGALHELKNEYLGESGFAWLDGAGKAHQVIKRSREKYEAAYKEGYNNTVKDPSKMK